MIVSSKEPEASRAPSDENVMEETASEWPSREVMKVPVSPFHSFTVLSSDAEASTARDENTAMFTKRE
jgi:hypothetical protein